MDKEIEDLSLSRQTAALAIFEALLILKEAGGQLSGKLEKKYQPNYL